MKRWSIFGLMLGVLIAMAAARAQEPQETLDSQQAQTSPDDVQASQLADPRFLLTEVRRIRRGFAIAPVPLALKGKNVALVGLGSYLVNAVGGCNDCHTNPPYAEGGDPFQGEPKRVNAPHYLAGGMQFGPFTSRNITPDENGRPGGLTYQQFLQVMRTGIDLEQAHPQISPLLQVMPWPVFQSMIERDLRAIYEYLRTIPHAEPGTGT